VIITSAPALLSDSVLIFGGDECFTLTLQSDQISQECGLQLASSNTIRHFCLTQAFLLCRFLLSEAQPKNAIIAPPQFGNGCKQASLFYKTNIFM
jgi:hypothetical protein